MRRVDGDLGRAALAKTEVATGEDSLRKVPEELKASMPPPEKALCNIIGGYAAAARSRGGVAAPRNELARLVEEQRSALRAAVANRTLLKWVGVVTQGPVELPSAVRLGIRELPCEIRLIVATPRPDTQPLGAVAQASHAGLRCMTRRVSFSRMRSCTWDRSFNNPTAISSSRSPTLAHSWHQCLPIALSDLEPEESERPSTEPRRQPSGRPRRRRRSPETLGHLAVGRGTGPGGELFREAEGNPGGCWLP